MHLTLAELIVRSADAGLCRQDRRTGAMPAGDNGWVGDAETPVRNTGHWAVVFFKAHAILGEPRFRAAAVAAADYLLTRDARPMNATFWHRLNPNKDACNGVLGSGFSVSALMAAYGSTGDERYRKVAQAVFRLHPFDRQRGIWKRVNVDGSIPRGLLYDFDLTLNHQIWLATAGALADPGGGSDIGRTVMAFLDGLNSKANLSVSRRGQISDEVLPHATALDRALSTARLAHRLLSSERRRYMYLKGLNYQGYSLFNLARISEIYPDHPLWRNPGLRRAVRMIGTDWYRQRIAEEAERCWNRSTGFELAKALQVFGETGDQPHEVSAEEWVRLEIDRHYDFETNLLTRNAVDAANQAANIHVATWLKDLGIRVPVRAGSGR